jgi:uncharacterized protein YecE (DUF72 family)
LLEDFQVAMCLHDNTEGPVDGPLVGPFVYVRFHGTSGRYHGSYGRTVLTAWGRRLTEAARAGRPVYAYFNNDPFAVATVNARTLRELLRRGK